LLMGFAALGYPGSITALSARYFHFDFFVARHFFKYPSWAEPLECLTKLCHFRDKVEARGKNLMDYSLFVWGISSTDGIGGEWTIF
jgi:hypothetical protein